MAPLEAEPAPPAGGVSGAGSGFRSGVVALIGRPNVGKSTLLNRLVGSKVSIVSNRPQTTRCRITGVRNLPDAQIVLLDTPGIHRPLHRMNQRMLRASLEALSGVDVVAVLTDVTEPFGGGDRFLVETLARVRAPVFLLVNKIDQVRKARILPAIGLWSSRYRFREIYPISAKSGEGVAELESGLVAELPEGPRLFPEGQVTDVSQRFLAAEIVREKVLVRTREEIPYSTTVLVERFEEPAEPGGLWRIDATVLVERDGQKAILIGKGGEMIRSIGQEARRELEPVLGGRLFLGLQVKVGRGWRDDDSVLDRLGLQR